MGGGGKGSISATNTIFSDINNEGGIGIYKSADPPKFEAKSVYPTMVLSKFGSTESSTMESQSRIPVP
jgi:hypothetical protein